LYGFIYDASGEELWRSQSARLLELGQTLNFTVTQGATSFYTLEIGNTPLFAYYYDVVWEIEDGQDRELRFQVLHHQAESMAEQRAYQQQLWQSLSLIGLLIIASQMAILRWGLQPLKRLAKDLVLVESGKANALQGDYPKEIQPVTDNLNQVLASERQQRQRYRNTLDDLAHSLKTPLSVISGTLQQQQGDQTIAEQVERMNQIISHQLQRAVGASPGVPGKAVAIQPIVERLITSLTKVYRDKGINADIRIDSEICFQGDERDLMEVLGNLIENAFKYGRQKVSITGDQTPQTITIIIEDDGKGVDKEARQTILQRGARADTATTGQGIGLAVAVDILSSYQGSLQVDESILGGAKFRLSLPR
jgi:two-component system sensor histidine kinase PhoQ